MCKATIRTTFAARLVISEFPILSCLTYHKGHQLTETVNERCLFKLIKCKNTYLGISIQSFLSVINTPEKKVFIQTRTYKLHKDIDFLHVFNLKKLQNLEKK